MRAHIRSLISALFIIFVSVIPAFGDAVSISPDKLDFGGQVLTTSSTRTVTLSNPTKKALNISSVSIDGDFYIAETSCGFLVVPAGVQCWITINFTPSATGLRTGTLVLRTDAGDGSLKVQLSGIGIPVQLTSLEVRPANPVIGVGAAISLSAIGHYNSGATAEVTWLATWTSSSPSNASIDSNGTAVALAQGTSTMTATYAGLTGSTVLTVIPPVITSLAINPSSVSVHKGLTQQLIASGSFSDGSTRDLTASVQWISSAPAVVGMNSTGLATALNQGSATIRAVSGGISTTATITVTAHVVVSVAITPGVWSMATTGTKQLTAIATYSDGPSFDATNTATWSTDFNSVATVSSTGLVTASQLGSTTISAFVANPGTIGFFGTAIVKVEFFTPGDTISARVSHNSVLLRDGRVLILGGRDDLGRLLDTAELFTPGPLGFQAAFGSVSATGSMATPREGADSTLLPGGKALVVCGAGATIANAELYNPLTGTFSLTGALNFPRFNCTATLLNTGQVLVAGGGTWSAELYDPSTGLFTPTGAMAFSRSGHTATLLKDGRVLIVGGGFDVKAAEIYDPAQGGFTPVGDLSVARYAATATLLPSGKVLVTGGVTGVAALATAEIFDPSTSAFYATSMPLTDARWQHTAALLGNGRVLVAGGRDFRRGLSSVEEFDPVSETFSLAGDMVNANSHDPSGTRFGHTATALANGQIVFIGGTMNDGRATHGILTYQAARQ